MTQNDTLELFKEGLNKFSCRFELTPYQQVALNAMYNDHENADDSIYNLIMDVIKKKMEEQTDKDIEEMKHTFENDMLGFLHLFISENGSTPKFINKAILQNLDDILLDKVLCKANPSDAMCLSSLISLRYSDMFLPMLMEEKEFVTRLKRVAKNVQFDNSKLSSIIIHNQLLPNLEKVEIKMNNRH